MNTQKSLNLNLLVLDERLQSRVEINEEMVAEYAHDMEQGDQFPPVTVHFDGIQYYLSDGFHRYHAARRIEKASIVANVIPGTFRDAQLYATSVNAKHGMRRTNADKRKAVMTMLDDFEWSQWSNAEIARHCGTSAAFVSNLRAVVEGDTKPETVKYRTPTGEVAEKKRAPGRKKQAKEEPEEEEAKDDTSETDAQQELIGILTKQLEDTRAQAVINLMDASDEDKKSAENLIKELQEENRLLKIELESVKASRDTFQNENAQLKRQVSMLMKKLKADK